MTIIDQFLAEVAVPRSETGWVIECDSPAGLLYWSAFKWSTDNLDAVRFARQVDAEMMLGKLGGRLMNPCMRVAEHMWCRNG